MSLRPFISSKATNRKNVLMLECCLETIKKMKISRLDTALSMLCYHQGLMFLRDINNVLKAFHFVQGNKQEKIFDA